MSAPSPRILWVDCFRGLCIVLVVFGHVAGGLAAGGLVQDGSSLSGVRAWVYLFHMPAFFFASGLFAAKLVQAPTLAFLRSRAATVVYPYCVWTGIVLASQCALARFANNPPDVARALRFPVEPYGYGLWFLYALLLISVVYQAAGRLKLPALGIAAAGLLMYLAASRDWFRFWTILNTSFTYFVYFSLGACFAPVALTCFEGKSWHGPMGLAAAAFAAMTLLHQFRAGPTPWIGLMLAALGIAGVLGLAKALVRLHLDRFWSYTGAHSLEVYLGHILLATLPRPLLKAAGISQPWVYVICGVGFGVLGSLVLMALCQRWRFPYLYRWPLDRNWATKPEAPTVAAASRQHT